MSTPPAINPSELKLLIVAWQSINPPPRVDYKTIAEKMGYMHAHSATGAFWKLKKKLQLDNNNGAASTQAAPVKKAGRKRKARVEEAEDGEEHTARASKSIKTARPAEGDVAVETGDEVRGGDIEGAGAAEGNDPGVDGHAGQDVEDAGVTGGNEPDVGEEAQSVPVTDTGTAGAQSTGQDDEVADDGESEGDMGDIGLAMFG